ncbi:thiamine pyrophosphate-binding protein [Brevibacillus sp. H7]|uniref:thiamine pyrophosphate-binding protein n=1 Tax=Brevibacillus sp. H7 TaxID=3349138 RepID=UPI0037F14B31
MQVAQYLTEQLALWEVRRIYGVAGDAILPWLDALGKQHQIKFVRCRHESAAAMMASAEAKLTGKPAVCTATSGPGTVNLLNGLADAHMDRVPVIAITGQVETYQLGGGYKQYVQQEGLLGPISHFSTTVASPEAIGEVLHKAFVTSMLNKGVSHLAICKDVFSRTTGAPLLPSLPRISPSVQADPMEVEQAADILLKAQKPLLLLGVGARQAKGACRTLAEKLGAGILITLGGKGVIPESHPLVLGGLGEGGSKAGLQALAEADLFIILGATWYPRAYLPKGLSVVQVDCNPEAFHAEPFLISVTADVNEVLSIWQRRLEGRRPNRDWVSRMEQLHLHVWEETRQLYQQDGDGPLKPETVINALHKAIRDDAIVALDTGEHTLWFNRAFRSTDQTPLFSGKWRTMGYALPAAIAAKLLDPTRQVAAIVGDGGLQMNLAELMTVVEQELAFPIIVLNNGTLGLEEWKMTQNGMTPYGTRMQNPDFARLAEAFGIAARTVRHTGELEEAMEEAFAAHHPMLVDVHCTLPTLTELKREIPFQAQA